MQAVALAVKTCAQPPPAPHSPSIGQRFFLLCRSAADCTRAVSGALGLMDGYNQRLLFANRHCKVPLALPSLPTNVSHPQAHGHSQVYVQSAGRSAPPSIRCLCWRPPHCAPIHDSAAGEEPAAASRSRDIELAGLQSRLAASTSELQRLNAERDSLVATMAVVDDVHARALQQVRAEAEASSQVRSEVGRGRRRWLSNFYCDARAAGAAAADGADRSCAAGGAGQERCGSRFVRCDGRAPASGLVFRESLAVCDVKRAAEQVESAKLGQELRELRIALDRATHDARARCECMRST